jgi:hypothetical protein
MRQPVTGGGRPGFVEGRCWSRSVHIIMENVGLVIGIVGFVDGTCEGVSLSVIRVLGEERYRP